MRLFNLSSRRASSQRSDQCSHPAEPLPAGDAKNHIGERATVCGKVASERTALGSRGQPNFINLDAPYPNQVFTILIWG